MSHDFNEQCLFFCSKAELEPANRAWPISDITLGQIPLWAFAAGTRHAAGPRANTLNGSQQCSKDHAGV